MGSRTRDQEEGSVRPLTKHQIAYCELRARGEGKRDARLDKLPQVQQHIQDLRDRAASITAYDVGKAMGQCDEAYEFARSKGNAMAMAKLLELKAKLSGLLIERVQVETVDLTAALEAARQRAANRIRLVNVPSEQELLEAQAGMVVTVS